MGKMTKAKTINYGQDAPGIRNGMIGIALIGLVFLFSAASPTLQRLLPISVARCAEAFGAVALTYGIWMGGYMTWSSRVGKLRTRDRLLDTAGSLRPWRDSDVVVDVGCGRGLMMIGAAKRLRNGVAIGVDSWRVQDQSGNSRDAVLANARDEGVFDRVRVETGDAMELPLRSQTADAVLSHWVVHNIELESDRLAALDEMWRVLKPGGVIVLADIGHVEEYRRHFMELGASQCVFFDGGKEAALMGVLSGGTYRPQALICLKPVAN